MATDETAYLLRDLTRELVLAGRQWRRIGRAVTVRHGVSEAAGAALVWLGRLGENVRQSALAEALGIEAASLVRLVDELEKAGLAERSVDRTDRRARSLSLTPSGRQVVQAVDEDLAALRREVFAAVPTEDVRAALRVFGAIAAAARGGDA